VPEVDPEIAALIGGLAEAVADVSGAAEAEGEAVGVIPTGVPKGVGLLLVPLGPGFSVRGLTVARGVMPGAAPGLRVALTPGEIVVCAGAGEVSFGLGLADAAGAGLTDSNGPGLRDFIGI
jgi:hypothetical protein